MEDRPFRTRNNKIEYFTDEEIARMKAQEAALAAQAFQDCRKCGYGDVGMQLGMIFDELKLHGTLSKDGPWFKHVQAVKDAHPKGEH